MTNQNPQKPKTQTQKVLEKDDAAVDRLSSQGEEPAPLVGADDIDPRAIRRRNHSDS